MKEEEIQEERAGGGGGGSIMREIERGRKIRCEKTGGEGGRMSANKAIYIRRKTVPLALTATS